MQVNHYLTKQLSTDTSGDTTLKIDGCRFQVIFTVDTNNGP